MIEPHAPTAEAMADPQPGDRFSEMLTFWVYVVRRDGDLLTTLEATGPCELPRDGKWRTYTLAEFQKRFAYSHATGYWVRLVDRGRDLAGWEPPLNFQRGKGL